MASDAGTLGTANSDVLSAEYAVIVVAWSVRAVGPAAISPAVRSPSANRTTLVVGGLRYDGRDVPGDRRESDRVASHHFFEWSMK